MEILVDAPLHNLWPDGKFDVPYEAQSWITTDIEPRVEPDFVWDWTQPVPIELYSGFQTVFVEKLSTDALAHAMLWDNCFRVLSPGGVLQFDYHLTSGIDPLSGPGLSLHNPFFMNMHGVITDDQAIVNEIQQQENDADSLQVKFAAYFSNFMLADTATCKVQHHEVHPFNGRRTPEQMIVSVNRLA